MSALFDNPQNYLVNGRIPQQSRIVREKAVSLSESARAHVASGVLMQNMRTGKYFIYNMGVISSVDQHWAYRNADTGSRIKYKRIAQHLSQADLAQMVGVGTAAVSQWEQGLRNPQGAVLKLLGQLLGLDEN